MTFDDSYYPDAFEDLEEPDLPGPEILGKDAALADEESVFSAALFRTGIISELADQKSTLSFLIARTRKEAIDALAALMDVDLYNTIGLSDARRLQANARRYFELVSWLRDAAKENEEQEQ
jgi:aminoglycoside phosphotransferase (APT) family kinase protein